MSNQAKMSKQILIIDDDPIYRMIVSKTIERIDIEMQIEHCENGQCGLDLLKELSTTDKPIIVLLDINMPLVNGWDFLELIIQNKFYDISALSIYIVSSSTDESDLIKAKKYNFLKGFVHKPIHKEELLVIFSK
ncbi:response regulator [Flavobacterium sp.]|uniref:response regulator n=1 Tax=Flavobacterium sp. TaxID=239 RepID=UPI0026396492|nr:response regulator [Flavobacterium sp.]MDG2433405.1 response regulator [Flavobacterium sp.]